MTEIKKGDKVTFPVDATVQYVSVYDDGENTAMDVIIELPSGRTCNTAITKKVVTKVKQALPNLKVGDSLSAEEVHEADFPAGVVLQGDINKYYYMSHGDGLYSSTYASHDREDDLFEKRLGGTFTVRVLPTDTRPLF